jgi:hypothetical protein
MEKSTSLAVNATGDCRRFTELAVVMAHASGISFHVQRFGFLFRLSPFIFRSWRRDDAGKLILSDGGRDGEGRALPLTIAFFL